MGYKRQLPGMQQYFQHTDHRKETDILLSHTNPETYRVCRFPRRDVPSSNSCYRAYLNLDPLCRHELYPSEIPSPPCNTGMAFGPTIDSWIGFQTTHQRDFNYTKNMQPLVNDNRCVTEEPSIRYFTPSIVESAVLSWARHIRGTASHDCSLCGHS